MKITREVKIFIVMLLLAVIIAGFLAGCIIYYFLDNVTAYCLFLLGTVILSLIEGMVILYLSMIHSNKQEILKFLKLEEESENEKN